ncbi:hypothetical protein SARC_08696, partial [Sphaeroforma arctica JP610]
GDWYRDMYPIFEVYYIPLYQPVGTVAGINASVFMSLDSLSLTALTLVVAGSEVLPISTSSLPLVTSATIPLSLLRLLMTSRNTLAAETSVSPSFWPSLPFSPSQINKC